MDDFLYRMFRLTRSQERLPREDFVSLCVGRALERDRALAKHVVQRIADRSTGAERTKLMDWLGDPEAPVRCRAQVPAWTPDGQSCRVDLLLELRHVRVVLEAKVGDSVPHPDQIRRYHQAFPEALVVPLVEERVREGCKAPALSWDDVLEGLCEGPGLTDDVEHLRQDLRLLFTEAEVGDTRLCVDPHAWTRARELQHRFNTTLLRRLKDCLVALAPNEQVRQAVRHAIEHHGCEPTEGWGVGLLVDKPIPGSLLTGLCFALDAGTFPDELEWQLEVHAAKDLIPHLERDGSWFPVRGAPGWFVTELFRSTGQRNLVKEDFARAVAHGRAALRHIHAGSKGAWGTRGPGEAPYAPKEIRVDVLHADVAAWNWVQSSLRRVAREVLHRVTRSDGGDTRPYRWHEGRWRTLPGRLPGDLRLHTSIPDDFGYLAIGWECAPPEFGAEVVAAWKDSALPPPQFAEGGVRLPLHADTWNARTMVGDLAGVLDTAIRRST